MASVKELNILLTAGAEILDTAASQIREIPLEPKEENIRKIAEALSIIFEVQREIFRIEPELEPEYLKKLPPYPGEGCRFGEVSIEAAEHEDNGDFQKAISIYEDFLAEGPPKMFADMARHQIERIKRNA